jgi:predicted GNAT superfamily acetyltransferase
VVVRSYAENFYGTDYGSDHNDADAPGLDSDRLFANWELRSERVTQRATGDQVKNEKEPVASIEIPSDWTQLVKTDPGRARAEQLRVREEFQNALAAGLICAGFERTGERPRYLLYESKAIAASLEDTQT